MVLGGGAVKSTRTGETSFHLAAMDMDVPSPDPATIPLSFLAHGVSVSPNDPDLLLLFEKHGPGACAVDLRRQEVRHVVTTRQNREFYGHGAFSPDGSLLYCTETDLEDKMKGYIAVRDGKTFEYMGDFPTHGLAPHDCILRDEGKRLVITNGGNAIGGGEPDRPAVTHVDVETGTLLEREPIPWERINAGHIAMTTDGGLAVVSAPREGLGTSDRGGISLRPADGELVTLQDPSEVTNLMLGETLSVAIHEATGTVAATNPLGHVVSFWNLDTGKLVKSLRIPNPRGVATSLNGREILVTFGDTAKISRLDAETLAAVDVPGNRDGVVCQITGSHITMYDTDTV